LCNASEPVCDALCHGACLWCKLLLIELGSLQDDLSMCVVQVLLLVELGSLQDDLSMCVVHVAAN